MGRYVRRHNPFSRSSGSGFRYSHEVWRARKVRLRRSTLPVISCRLPDYDISLLQEKVAIHPHSCRGDCKSQDCACWVSWVPVFIRQSHPSGTVEEMRSDGCSTLRRSGSCLLPPDTDGRRDRPRERQVSSNSGSAPFSARVAENSLDIVLTSASRNAAWRRQVTKRLY
jgi:hypothetical protein